MPVATTPRTPLCRLYGRLDNLISEPTRAVGATAAAGNVILTAENGQVATTQSADGCTIMYITYYFTISRIFRLRDHYFSQVALPNVANRQNQSHWFNRETCPTHPHIRYYSTALPSPPTVLHRCAFCRPSPPPPLLTVLLLLLLAPDAPRLQELARLSAAGRCRSL